MQFTKVPTKEYFIKRVKFYTRLVGLFSLYNFEYILFILRPFQKSVSNKGTFKLKNKNTG